MTLLAGPTPPDAEAQRRARDLLSAHTPDERGVCLGCLSTGRAVAAEVCTATSWARVVIERPTAPAEATRPTGGCWDTTAGRRGRHHSPPTSITGGHEHG